MSGKERREIGRAVSMAEAAPILSQSPRGGGGGDHHQPGSAFQDGDGAFDSSYGRTAAGGAAATARGGGGASNSRKPGRCVCVCCVSMFGRVCWCFCVLSPTASTARSKFKINASSMIRPLMSVSYPHRTNGTSFPGQRFLGWLSTYVCIIRYMVRYVWVIIF